MKFLRAPYRLLPTLAHDSPSAYLNVGSSCSKELLLDGAANPYTLPIALARFACMNFTIDTIDIQDSGHRSPEVGTVWPPYSPYVGSVAVWRILRGSHRPYEAFSTGMI